MGEDEDALGDDDLILAGAGVDMEEDEESGYNQMLMAESGLGYPTGTKDGSGTAQLI